MPGLGEQCGLFPDAVFSDRSELTHYRCMMESCEEHTSVSLKNSPNIKVCHGGTHFPKFLLSACGENRAHRSCLTLPLVMAIVDFL
jgi:hypothetical protein